MRGSPCQLITGRAAYSIAFNEDLSRKRAGNAAQNYSCLNRIALNLLKKDNAKIGIKGKRKIVGWDNEYIFKIIKN